MNRMNGSGCGRWQLGDDDRFSFQSRPEFADQTLRNRRHFRIAGFGQPLD